MFDCEKVDWWESRLMRKSKRMIDELALRMDERTDERTDNANPKNFFDFLSKITSCRSSDHLSFNIILQKILIFWI